jgi:hypothetical protein
MVRPQTFVLSALGALVALTLGTAASGADTEGTLAIVNGIPGKRIDVCINGKEIKSSLAYGGHIFRDVVSPGNKNLSFYERDPRTCRGRRVAQDSFYLDNGNDVTIVVTKNTPKVVYFYNQEPFLGEIPPRGNVFGSAGLAWRNASEMPVNFRTTLWVPNPEIPSTPAADAIFAKGQQVAIIFGDDYVFQVRARLPGSAETLAVHRFLLVLSHRYEWLLVGTNPSNARFVVFDRIVSAPSP